MNFTEYLTDIREEEVLCNLAESLIATEEEKKELDRLTEKNTKVFIYFKKALDEHKNFIKLQNCCSDGRLNYTQLGKALVHIKHDTNMNKLLKEAEDF